jgi:hypothetical protein
MEQVCCSLRVELKLLQGLNAHLTAERDRFRSLAARPARLDQFQSYEHFIRWFTGEQEGTRE